MEQGSENAKDSRHRQFRRRLWRLSLLSLIAILFATYFRRPLFEGNWGVVDGDIVFRSAQPKGDVVGMINAHKLGSVLNLRGGKTADSWYSAEVDATAKTGAEFYDLPMSAVRRPSRRELLVLLDVLDHCRYPLLIHCKSGSDRTGLVVALYQMYRKGESPSQALSSFSLAYGHVPLLGPEHLHEPLHEYAAWLKKQNLPHTPERFVDWVKHDYAASDALVDLPPTRPGPRPPRETAQGEQPVVR